VAIRINAVISETTKLGLGMQILEIITQRMFVSVMCHSQSFDATKSNIAKMYWSRQDLSIDLKKNLPRPL